MRMARAEHIRLRVTPVAGVSPTKVLAAIREYLSASTRAPWEVLGRTPLALAHRSPRAAGVRYTLKPDKEELAVTLNGARARLGLAYVITLFANTRFDGLISSIRVELPGQSTR
jgi:hypothetical protein